MPRRSSTVKDEEVYRALVEEGASKHKAARIANAAARDGRSAVARRGGKASPYEEWTVNELRQRAKELGVRRYSRLRKAELVQALRHS